MFVKIEKHYPFSPGTWFLRGTLIECPSHTVAAISKTHFEINRKQALADALLLTASPLMYGALWKAKDFYERMLEATGGCDHSVGICECSDQAEYEQLCALLHILSVSPEV